MTTLSEAIKTSHLADDLYSQTIQTEGFKSRWDLPSTNPALVREITAACNYARTAHETWLAQRGLTLEEAKALPLQHRLELQEAYAQQFAERN